ncbi:unnamed protein product [Protopolystoma xenopodis]|uniref:Uncharacterized protein n=1 Tax=Protopolystoma xenopodis TaxID=117903 RepID=A0A448WTM3_9PLAT|nr:unnamed protein product [Protopolystoma xenopodis]
MRQSEETSKPSAKKPSAGPLVCGSKSIAGPKQQIPHSESSSESDSDSDSDSKDAMPVKRIQAALKSLIEPYPHANGTKLIHAKSLAPVPSLDSSDSDSDLQEASRPDTKRSLSTGSAVCSKDGVFSSKSDSRVALPVEKLKAASALVTHSSSHASTMESMDSKKLDTVTRPLSSHADSVSIATSRLSGKQLTKSSDKVVCSSRNDVFSKLRDTLETDSDSDSSATKPVEKVKATSKQLRINSHANRMIIRHQDLQRRCEPFLPVTGDVGPKQAILQRENSPDVDSNFQKAVLV